MHPTVKIIGKASNHRKTCAEFSLSLPFVALRPHLRRLLSASTAAFLTDSRSGLSAKIGGVQVSSRSRVPLPRHLTPAASPWSTSPSPPASSSSENGEDDHFLSIKIFLPPFFVYVNVRGCETCFSIVWAWNSWLWDVDGTKILVDQILVGNLDFGTPWLYDATKKVLKNLQVTSSLFGGSVVVISCSPLITMKLQHFGFIQILLLAAIFVSCSTKTATKAAFDHVGIEDTSISETGSIWLDFKGENTTQPARRLEDNTTRVDSLDNLKDTEVDIKFQTSTIGE